MRSGNPSLSPPQLAPDGSRVSAMRADGSFWRQRRQGESRHSRSARGAGFALPPCARESRAQKKRRNVPLGCRSAYRVLMERKRRGRQRMPQDAARSLRPKAAPGKR